MLSLTLDLNLNLNLQVAVSSDVSKRTTKNSQDLQISLLKTATGQRTFHYRTVKNWNTLDPSLKLCKSIKQFKAKLKEKLLKEFLN